MTTILQAYHPISHVLIDAVKYLETKHTDEKFKIMPRNDHQHLFLNKFHYPDDLSKFSSVELRSKVSEDIKEINSWLRENGYDIQLTVPPERREGDFAVASILEVMTKWIKEAKETIISNGNSLTYKAFSVDSGIRAAYPVKNYKHPVISLDTQGDDIVELLKADIAKDPTQMRQIIREKGFDLTSGKNFFYGKIIIPELNIDIQPDISWLCKLDFKSFNSDNTLRNWYLIEEALQQIKFKMNKVGTEVKTAAAISCRSGSLCFENNLTYTFDTPFYVWITRKGTTQPYFAAYIDYDSFQTT